MEKDNSGEKYSGFFSKKLKAGKRRTYFFDVRSTKQGDFFLTITESKKKFDGEGYESHKIFLYKEDFKKFVDALSETVNYVKTELLPGYDFDAEHVVRPGDENADNSRPARNDGFRQEKPQPKTLTEKDQSEATTSTVPPHISDDEQVDWN